jgi:hypothetical protein
MHSIENKILSRIYGKGRGCVFTTRIFSDLGSAAAVRIALLRHKRAGFIRHLARGIYDYPQQHATLGTLMPSADAIAKALAGQDATRLQPSGAYAANLLGLSTQVPMRIVFLTDGPNRKVVIGKQQIMLKHTTPRNMASAGRVSGMVIQAMRHIGQRNVDKQTIALLRKRLSEVDKKQLLNDIRYAPAWIADHMRRIVQPDH